MALDKKISRRNMLKLTGCSALAMGAVSAMGARLSELCTRTPQQPQGPFYPVESQLDTNTDLTWVEGGKALAQGDFVYLTGTVSDEQCAPVPNAVVEIWQACHTGRYDHPGDTENPNPLDPNFQYWGIASTDQAGRYSFKTILPGHYLAAPGWTRPPHIHFKVHKNAFQELITQLYFEGNIYNAGDRILQRIPASDRTSVIRPLTPRAPEQNRKTYDVSFDITIQRIA